MSQRISIHATTPIGYIGTGFRNNNIPFRDFWAYHPNSNQWMQVALLPGVARSYASAFVIDNKAYVGLGWSATNALLSDWWEFDPNRSPAWKAINSGPSGRIAATAFSINGKGYVLGGSFLEDFWEFTPNEGGGNWKRLPNWPGGPRRFAKGLNIGDRAMVVGGENTTNRVREGWIYSPE